MSRERVGPIAPEPVPVEPIPVGPSAVDTDRGLTRQRQVTPRHPRNAWNRSLSWELIFNITPHLPTPILAVVHHLTSIICFAAMGRQRRATQANLRRIDTRRGLANLLLAYRTFHQFSRFMVAYAELRRPNSRLPSTLADGDTAERATRALVAEGSGRIVLTAHLGQWDVGLRHLAGIGVPVHVVMQETEARDVARHAGEIREAAAVQVHQSGSSHMLGLELALALRRGHVVALQGDRPLGEHDHPTTVFGAPLSLPTGPLRLARATGAPILPVFTVFVGDRALRIECGEVIRVPKGRGPLSAAELETGMAQIGRALEEAIARHPDQWFCFSDAWADAATAHPPATSESPGDSGEVGLL